MHSSFYLVFNVIQSVLEEEIVASSIWVNPAAGNNNNWSSLPNTDYI